MGKNKKAKSRKIPGAKKHPRSILEDYLQETPAWKFNAIDLDGEWSCKNIDRDLIISSILPRIQCFETMKWSEIRGGEHHDINISNLSPKAQRRLEEIYQEDIDSLFSFRIDGIKRLWCILDRHIAKIIWWDPKHEVCPSPLKHT
jgi:hypothetical protein